MGRFSNKVVIVTGSSTGIGQACAILFAKEGGKVTITGRSEKTLAETRQQLERIGTSTENYLTLTGDIQNELFRAELIKKTIEKWGRLDVLVNNAGVSNKPGCDIDSLETFDYVFSINVRSLYDLTVLALPHILKTKGNVVSVSSICSFRPFTSCNFYCMAKAAVDQFTRAFAVQHAPKGIRFNNVNPGFTKTPVFSKNQHADTVSVSSERRQSFNQVKRNNIMFGGRDPRNPFDAYFVINQMNRHINQLDTMMDQLMDPISATHASIFHGVPRAMRASPLEMIYPRQPSQTLQPMDAPMMGMMNPFGFGGMFGGLMGQMNSLQHHAMNDPNAHAFSHSTFISFDGSGSGPHVVHSSVRRAGDATETRHSVHRGGEAEEISVGHRIGNRSHTIEKKRDAEGRLRGQQLFENLDDGEAASFDREFQRRVRRSFGGHNRDYLAVQDNEIRGTRRPAGRDSSTADVNRANVPIITIPDDDDEEPVLSARAQRARDRSHKKQGVIIEEIE